MIALNVQTSVYARRRIVGLCRDGDDKPQLLRAREPKLYFWSLRDRDRTLIYRLATAAGSSVDPLRFPAAAGRG